MQGVLSPVEIFNKKFFFKVEGRGEEGKGSEGEGRGEEGKGRGGFDFQSLLVSMMIFSEMPDGLNKIGPTQTYG